jgi:hypothetical protein
MTPSAPFNAFRRHSKGPCRKRTLTSPRPQQPPISAGPALQVGFNTPDMWHELRWMDVVLISTMLSLMVV